MKKVAKFFDRLEDRVRGFLSRVPIFYAIIGGITVVLFWRGVWNLADIFEKNGGWWGYIYEPTPSLIISILVLLFTGLFVSFFIGDRIILSGLKHEKKIEEKTESEVRQEEVMLSVLSAKIDILAKEVADLKSTLKDK